MSDAPKSLPLWARCIQVVLYAPGPFFVYSYKPLLNAVLGCPYEEAFENFRRDHTKKANIAFHVLALFLQVFSNFALLARLDEFIPITAGLPRGILSISSGLLWVLVLLLGTPSPPLVKIASTLVLAAAGFVGPMLISPAVWLWLPLGNVLVEYMALEVFIRKKEPSIVGAVRFLLIRLPLQYLLTRTYCGSLSSYTKQIALGTVAGMLFLSGRDDPTGQSAAKEGKRRLSPFMFGLFGWMFAAVTREPAFYFWANAFSASLLQGVAHAYGKEAGTLINLQQDPSNTIAHELSHTVFFPNLLLHTIYEKFFGKTQHQQQKQD